ncbi:hypothetical protein JOF56_003467 [Kibdelosporangium banguiense]|uniref:Uncharacterized protein n=1 Tax=Kibdelosporangium banguiense TaxID=1365924 RepID=A0ABS4TF92_9PSEU|nr:hypothetical protein [Kibdelosporangium banguiense]
MITKRSSERQLERSVVLLSCLSSQLEQAP